MKTRLRSLAAVALVAVLAGSSGACRVFGVVPETSNRDFQRGLAERWPLEDFAALTRWNDVLVTAENAALAIQLGREDVAALLLAKGAEPTEYTAGTAILSGSMEVVRLVGERAELNRKLLTILVTRPPQTSEDEFLAVYADWRERCHCEPTESLFLGEYGSIGTSLNVIAARGWVRAVELVLGPLDDSERNLYRHSSAEADGFRNALDAATSDAVRELLVGYGFVESSAEEIAARRAEYQSLVAGWRAEEEEKAERARAEEAESEAQLRAEAEERSRAREAWANDFANRLSQPSEDDERMFAQQRETQAAIARARGGVSAGLPAGGGGESLPAAEDAEPDSSEPEGASGTPPAEPERGGSGPRSGGTAKPAANCDPPRYTQTLVGKHQEFHARSVAESTAKANLESQASAHCAAQSPPPGCGFAKVMLDVGETTCVESTNPMDKGFRCTVRADVWCKWAPL